MGVSVWTQLPDLRSGPALISLKKSPLRLTTYIPSRKGIPKSQAMTLLPPLHDLQLSQLG
jgi:hypothetical protein